MYLPVVVYVVIIAVAVACVSFGTDVRDTALAFGCVLTASKILLDFVKEYREKKAKDEDKQERVEVTLECRANTDNTPAWNRLSLVLLNPSHTTPLRIKSVKWLGQGMFEPVDMPLFANLVWKDNRWHSDQSVDIEPRKSATFRHWPMGSSALRELKTLEDYGNAEIVVSTHVGEIHRIDGKTISDRVANEFK